MLRELRKKMEFKLCKLRHSRKVEVIGLRARKIGVVQKKVTGPIHINLSIRRNWNSIIEEEEGHQIIKIEGRVSI